MGFVLSFGIAYGLNSWKNSEVEAAVSAAKTAITLEYNQRLIRLQKSADAVSLNMMVTIKENEDAKQKSINSINARYNSIIAGLRDRPSRPPGISDSTGNSSDAKSTEGVTGVRLYAEDGRFLMGEATRAEMIKQELLHCYRQYDEVKDSINSFIKDSNERVH